MVRAFHTILKSREFVRSADASVRSLEVNLSVAQRRLEAGALLKADLLDIEVRLAQVREELIPRAQLKYACGARAPEFAWA